MLLPVAVVTRLRARTNDNGYRAVRLLTACVSARNMVAAIVCNHLPALRQVLGGRQRSREI